MATQKEINDALALMAKVKEQRQKQQDKWKEYREIAQMVIEKATAIGKQGAVKDWLTEILKKH